MRIEKFLTIQEGGEPERKNNEGRVLRAENLA
ncbi:uncharacterized protein G2W53_022443 [Senna tora]|uniref:Uncharacterized protein n=1 Tax=Senna tora TaxID=362788 RepID=A0A834WP53_9FABA|nr:uncharacterized protein G2W53_022443 [Senna tora]